MAYAEVNIRTFRADRMVAVHAGEQEKQGKELFESFDLGKYTKEEKIEMVFYNNLIDNVIDKCGSEVRLSPVDDYHFKITVPVAVSP